MAKDCILPLRIQVLNGALMLACEHASEPCHTAIVRQALQMGADVTWYERECEHGPLRALMDAWSPDGVAWQAQIDIIDLLIDAGADVDYFEKTGIPAVWCASERGNYDLVKCLIAHGADVNAQASYSMDDKILAAPLHYLNLGTADLLLAAGCEVDSLFKENGQDMSAMDVILDHIKGDGRDDAMELILKYHPDHDWGYGVNEFISVWQECPSGKPA